MPLLGLCDCFPAFYSESAFIPNVPAYCEKQEFGLSPVPLISSGHTGSEVIPSTALWNNTDDAQGTIWNRCQGLNAGWQHMRKAGMQPTILSVQSLLCLVIIVLYLLTF